MVRLLVLIVSKDAMLLMVMMNAPGMLVLVLTTLMVCGYGSVIRKLWIHMSMNI